VIGESIGNYRITARLGRGGMGEVYVAEHDGIKTHVAIKMLLPEVSRSEEHVKRFFNEAIIVGRIKHAGIVKIFDSGFFDGHAYLMMELLEGETLAARIAHGTLAPAQVVEVARQIASILDATHRAGVIHRDLKPDNIFLVTDHELPHGERVKILDFGISKLSGTLAGGSPRTQGTMGTPQYMAPEQWGDSATVDWRADAYSLGCVCYEMLTGQPPFDAHNIAEAYAKHLTAEPPPLTDVPAPLDALVLRLLAKRAADRAPSMAMVVGELDELARTIDPDAKPTVPRHARMATGPTQAQTAGTDPTVRLGKPPQTTTLGAAASQLEVTAPRSRRFAAVIGGIAVVATAAVIVVAATRGSSTEATNARPNAQPSARPAPVAQPALAAQPIATPPPPVPPTPPTPEPTPVVTATPAPTPPAPTHITTKHHVATHPVATPSTPTPPSTPVGSDSDPWGGRR
jgi:serine/threonine-protein kinase